MTARDGATPRGPKRRALGTGALVLGCWLGAVSCQSSDRSQETSAPETATPDVPPPYLLPADLAAFGSEAGQSLVAATAAVGSHDVIAIQDFVADMPWKELARALDPRIVTDGIREIAGGPGGLRLVPLEIARLGSATPTTAALVGRMTACVRRSGGGRVSADYALLLTVIEAPSGRVPWAQVFLKTKEGSKGPLVAHTLLGSDLDGLAREATAAVTSVVRERGAGALCFVPGDGLDRLALGGAFSDRLLAGLVGQGHAVFMNEARAGDTAPRVAVRVEGVSDDPVADTETYRFTVEISGADPNTPWKRWERVLARSGGRRARDESGPR